MYLEQLSDIKKKENKFWIKLDLPNYLRQIEAIDLARIHSFILNLGSFLLILPYSVKYDEANNYYYTVLKSRKRVRFFYYFLQIPLVTI